MNTQVVFKMDKALKKKAMQKAQSHGIPFGLVLKLAAKAYVDGRLSIEMVPEERFNAKTRKELEEIEKDIKAGKNLSPAFKTTKEVIAWLEK